MENYMRNKSRLDKRERRRGTRGFDAAKSNAELEKILEEKRGDDDG